MKFLLILFILSFNSFAQDLSVGSNITKIDSLRKNSSLKFTITRGDGSTFIFSGFFVMKEGFFATVFHEFKNSKFINKDSGKLNTDLSFKLEDALGNQYQDFEILACSDSRNIDLCIGRVGDIKNKNFITISDNQNTNNEFNSYGNCNADFSSKKGKVVKSVNSIQQSYSGAYQDPNNQNVKMLELSIPSCVGDSGGALFDPYTGHLLGMYSFEMVHLRKYFAIDTSEIKSFLTNNLNSSLIKIKTKGNNLENLINEDPCKGKNLSEKEREFCEK